MGLKVGHATRSVDESIRQARNDMTIRTAILETRFLTGDQQLYDELVARFDKEVVQGSAAEFVTAKLAEREERHRRAGQSRYLVEPNVKDGKGGLRDLHTLYWIAKYVYRVQEREELIEHGVYDRREYTRFRRCGDFLWAVRCNLHFATGRAEDVDMLAEDYVQNSGWTPDGRDAFASALVISRGAMPDGRAIQTHMVAEGNRVASRSVWDGTISQSGRPADFTTLDFFRIENGVIAEHWESVDWVRAYQSFGLLSEEVNDA